MNAKLNGRLIDRQDITADLAIFRIAKEDVLFEFKAGQYTVIGLPASAPRLPSCDPEEEGGDPNRMIRRAYSIASSSKVGEYVELYITLVGSGELTPRLWNLRVGDPLWVGPKATGHFTLDDAPEDANLLLVATGTGLAPFVSMIRTEHVCNVGRRFVVVHGARYSWDLGYRAMMERLHAECGQSFAYLPTVSRPERDPDWGGHVGRIQSVFEDGSLERLLGEPLSPEKCHAFLCGNPDMVVAVQELLEKRYYLHTPRQPGTVHVEKYW